MRRGAQGGAARLGRSAACKEGQAAASGRGRGRRRACRYMTESEYAVDRQVRPRILNICTVVTSVERPWRMMSVQGMTLARLAVNGEAMLASPGFTIATCVL